MDDLLLTERWFPIPVKARNHPIQKAISECRTQYICIAAGRRSYKTERFIKRDAVMHCMDTKHSKQQVLVGAPTRPQAKQIFWNDFKALTPKFALARRPNETELSIEFNATGSTLHVVGLKEYSRVEGILWHRAYITEMQKVSPDFFGATLEPILNDTGGRGVFEGRPLGKNHFFDMYCKAKTNPDLWSSFTWTSEDILSEQQIRNAKATLGIEDYKREYLADFEVGGQRAYYAFSNENLKEFELDTNHVIVACDFNATDKPMSWNVGCMKEGLPHWWKSLSHTFTNTETMCTVLETEFLGLPSYPARIIFYGDYAGMKSTSNSSLSDWEIIRRAFHGKNIEIKYKPCKSVRNRTAATNAMLCNSLDERRMFIHPQCKALIRDYERVQWKSNGVELDQDKDMTLTHCSDAVDYFCDYEYPITGKPVYGGV